MTIGFRSASPGVETTGLGKRSPVGTESYAFDTNQFAVFIKVKVDVLCELDRFGDFVVRNRQIDCASVDVVRNVRQRGNYFAFANM